MFVAGRNCDLATRCYTTTYITVTEEAEESEEEGEESGEEREDGEELRRADERRRGPNGRSESSGPIGQLSCARWFFERLAPLACEVSSAGGAPPRAGC